ncbi:hypothetical protein FE236_13380 [Mariprofundus erugo]|nr:hypothetical protein FE236_13380 [Mariprofundus erugo]
MYHQAPPLRVISGGAFFYASARADTNHIAMPFSARVQSSALITVSVPDEYIAYFDKAVRKEIFKSFGNGSNLKMEYRFISFDEGSRFKRYLAGGIGDWGCGTLLIQADFFDATGKKLSSVQTEAVISGGLLGGSFESAIDKAVEKLAEYAIANFKG